MGRTKIRRPNYSGFSGTRDTNPPSEQETPWGEWNTASEFAKLPPQPVVLVGLDNIARAVGAGQLAIRRWIKEENFPARRCSDGIYRADPDAIRRWFGNAPQQQP